MLLAKPPVQDFVNLFYLAYHSLILIALMLAVTAYRKGKTKALYLMLVLLATFVVETAAGVLKFYHVKGQAWIYHVYNLFEYSFLALYYLKNCPVARFKPAVRVSIPLFIVFGLSVSGWLYQFKSMPALNLNVEGCLLFLMYTHLLFSIETDMFTPVRQHPDFWIATGVLVFFGGAFVFFNVYRMLLHLNYLQTLAMFGRIMGPLNVFLYICLIIGLLCLHRNRTYSAPLG
jgi:hypothetical protein